MNQVVIAVNNALKEPKLVYHIDLPYEAPGWYRQVMSWDAFFNYKHKRNHKKLSDGTTMFFHRRWFDEHEMDKEAWENTMKKYSDLPPYSTLYHDPIKVETVWELWKLIGYDYKTKKWISND